MDNIFIGRGSSPYEYIIILSLGQPCYMAEVHVCPNWRPNNKAVAIAV